MVCLIAILHSGLDAMLCMTLDIGYEVRHLCGCAREKSDFARIEFF